MAPPPIAPANNRTAAMTRSFRVPDKIGISLDISRFHCCGRPPPRLRKPSGRRVLGLVRAGYYHRLSSVMPRSIAANSMHLLPEPARAAAEVAIADDEAGQGAATPHRGKRTAETAEQLDQAGPPGAPPNRWKIERNVEIAHLSLLGRPRRPASTVKPHS